MTKVVTIFNTNEENVVIQLPRKEDRVPAKQKPTKPQNRDMGSFFYQNSQNIGLG